MISRILTPSGVEQFDDRATPVLAGPGWVFARLGPDRWVSLLDDGVWAPVEPDVVRSALAAAAGGTALSSAGVFLSHLDLETAAALALAAFFPES